MPQNIITRPKSGRHVLDSNLYLLVCSPVLYYLDHINPRFSQFLCYTASVTCHWLCLLLCIPEALRYSLTQHMLTQCILGKVADSVHSRQGYVFLPRQVIASCYIFPPFLESTPHLVRTLGPLGQLRQAYAWWVGILSVNDRLELCSCTMPWPLESVTGSQPCLGHLYCLSTAQYKSLSSFGFCFYHHLSAHQAFTYSPPGASLSDMVSCSCHQQLSELHRTL